MRRRVFLLPLLLTAAVGFAAWSFTASGNVGKTKSKAGKQDDLTIKVTPLSPTQGQIDAAINALRTNATTSLYFKGTRTRLLSFEVLDRPRLAVADPWRAVFYDYSFNRNLTFEGSFGNTRNIAVTQPNAQPLSNDDEFNAAAAVVRADPYWGPLLAAGQVVAYRPMPPLAYEEAGIGAPRTLTVGLRSSDARVESQIVGVNMIQNAVVSFPNGAPPTSVSTPNNCGIPNAGQATTARNTAGQFDVVATQGGTEIWRMTAIRPAASSGLRGSGLELRNVTYRGKPLFKRAHVPILNVLYDGNACGPYRDWQWQEGMFSAIGSDVAAGVRNCVTEPQTVMENGTDAGNFRGLAYYVDGTSLTLVSEMEAGWYRYISRWTFGLDGSVRPEFGFDGVFNSCVCTRHHHHVFFRLDLDVAGAGRNLITEYDTPFFGRPLLTETKSFRDYARNRYWTIENQSTGELFRLDAGPHDGTALGDSYARYDLVFLRYRATELDDGYNNTGGSGTPANLDQFINGEALDGQDVVIWYAGHSTHIFDGAGGGHTVGPTLRPVRW